jgi:hypothetical protein
MNFYFLFASLETSTVFLFVCQGGSEKIFKKFYLAFKFKNKEFLLVCSMKHYDFDRCEINRELRGTSNSDLALLAIYKKLSYKLEIIY